MAKGNLRNKYIGTITQNLVGGVGQAGLSNPLQIDSLDMLKKLSLHLVVGITYPFGGATSAVLENPQTLLRGINFYAGGRPIKQTISGKNLYVINSIDRGTKPAINASVGNEAAGSYVLDVHLEMNFQSLKMQNPYKTLFPSYKFNKLDFSVIWGDITDITATVGATLDSAYIDVEAEYLAGVAAITPVNFERETIYDAIGGANPAAIFKLDVGSAYRRILIRAEHGFNVPSDAIINDITLQIGSYYVKDHIIYQQTQYDNKSQYNLENWFPGIVILDFPKSTGDWDKLLDARLAQICQMQLNVNNPVGAVNYISALMQEIKPKEYLL